eukprot:1291460-Rhodomonas_salina.1
MSARSSRQVRLPMGERTLHECVEFKEEELKSRGCGQAERETVAWVWSSGERGERKREVVVSWCYSG